MQQTEQARARRARPFGEEAFGPSDATTLRWLGMAGFLINSRGTTIMVDPLLEGFGMPIAAKDVPGVDAILVTHSATAASVRCPWHRYASKCRGFLSAGSSASPDRRTVRCTASPAGELDCGGRGPTAHPAYRRGRAGRPAVQCIAEDRGVSVAAGDSAWEVELAPTVIPIPGASRPASIQDFVRAADLDSRRTRSRSCPTPNDRIPLIKEQS